MIQIKTVVGLAFLSFRKLGFWQKEVGGGGAVPQPCPTQYRQMNVLMSEFQFVL